MHELHSTSAIINVRIRPPDRYPDGLGRMYLSQINFGVDVNGDCFKLEVWRLLDGAISIYLVMIDVSSEHTLRSLRTPLLHAMICTLSIRPAVFPHPIISAMLMIFTNAALFAEPGIQLCNLSRP